MITCEVNGRFHEEMSISFGIHGCIRNDDNYGRNDNG
jgi:hypothetical protein